MNLAFFAQAFRHIFQHDAHGRRYLSQHPHFFRGHAPGIDVGQQTGFFHHPSGNMSDIFQGGAEAHLVKGLAGNTMAEFRFLTQGKQRFLAAHCLPLVCDRDGFIR